MLLHGHIHNNYYSMVNSPLTHNVLLSSESGSSVANLGKEEKRGQVNGMVRCGNGK